MSDYLKRRMQFILDDRPLPEKKKYTLNKVSEKRKKKLEEQKASGSDKELGLWFDSRRKEMSGKCLFCGSKTLPGDDKMFRFSVAHLLDKKENRFPSVKTHPDNWIELCFYENSCHTNFDHKMIELADIKEQMPKAWEIIVGKFLKIYPSIAIEERRLIPDILLNYIPKESDMI